MPTNFHESYAGGEIKPPSERSTGLVFAAMAAIVAVLWRHSPTVPWLATAAAMGPDGGQPVCPGSVQAPEHSLVPIGTALASGRESRRDVRHVRAGVRARRHDHAYLARPAQIAAHNSRLKLLD